MAYVAWRADTTALSQNRLYSLVKDYEFGYRALCCFLGLIGNRFLSFLPISTRTVILLLITQSRTMFANNRIQRFEHATEKCSQPFVLILSKNYFFIENFVTVAQMR
jgi:hypothetical protein